MGRLIKSIDESVKYAALYACKNVMANEWKKEGQHRMYFTGKDGTSKIWCNLIDYTIESDELSEEIFNSAAKHINNMIADFHSSQPH